MSDLQIKNSINIDGYTEPLYISKRELFNEDMYMAIVQDDRFCKKDRDYLKRYFKERRESGGIATVVYQFGKGCDVVRLGRLFPTLGLGTMRFDIRNVLTANFYWDIDFENCHYRIALKLCKEYGIQCDKIEDYINNRDEWLNKVSPDRWVAKTVFLRTAYSDVKLYREDWEDKSGAVVLNDEVQLFVSQVSKQFHFLADKLWDMNKDLQKLKCGKDNKPISKRDNPKFSLLSYILQTEERKHLLFLDWYLQKKGRYMGILIHDGGNVEKLPNETEFPVELLRECEEAVNKKFGTGMKLAIKPINHSYVIPEKIQQLSPYEVYKLEFEEKHFLLQGRVCCIDNNQIKYLSNQEITNKMKNKYWMEESEDGKKMIKKEFYKEWLEDKNRRDYERIDFIPDVSKCPTDTYNLFRGFEAEKYKFNFTDEEIMKHIEPVLTHINLLSGGYGEWMSIWLANIIQQPDIKSGVAPLLRDQSGILSIEGGTGKNLFFEWFGNEIVGEKYSMVVGDNATLYEKHNSVFEGKLLIMIEEASGKENHLNLDVLKSRITGKKLNVNRKSVAQYDVKDYARFIFATNNRNAIPITNGNRRFAVFDTNKSKRGNVEYFDNLVSAMEQDEVKYSFFEYLRRIVKTHKSQVKYSESIPATKGYVEMKKLNAPLIVKWIISMIRNGTIQNKVVSELHKDFSNWLKENKEGGEDKAGTLTAFGLQLNGDENANADYAIDEQGLKKKNGKGLIEYKWNKQGIVDGLKKLLLIDNEFVYESAEDRDHRLEQEAKDALAIQMKEKMELEMMAEEDVNAYHEQTTEEGEYDSDAELIEYNDSDDE
jgi:hypothetical protein